MSKMKEPLWIRFFFPKRARGYYRMPDRKESPWDILSNCIRSAMMFCDLFTLLLIGMLLGKVIDISLFQALIPIIVKVGMNLFIDLIDNFAARKKEEYDEKQYKEAYENDKKRYKEYFSNMDEFGLESEEELNNEDYVKFKIH